MHKRSVAASVLIFTAALLGGSTATAQKDKQAPALADVKGVANLAYAPDGSFLLIDYRAGGGRPDQSNASLGVWDAKTGEFRVGMDKVPTACDRIAVSPDGTKAAAIAVGPKQLKIWDVKTGKIDEDQKLPDWKGSIVNAPFLKFTPDGKALYSVWDKQILEHKLGGKPRLLSPKLQSWTTEEMAFDPQNKLLMVAHNIMGRPTSELIVYNLDKDGESQKVMLDGHVRAMAVSPDGKTLAISFLPNSKKSKFELWDLPSFKMRSAFPADSRMGFEHYRTLAFAADGKSLAGAPQFSAKTDKVTDVLDLEGKITREITGTNFYVKSLTFSPDGKTLAAILGDDTLRFFDPATGEAKKP
jgi:WD40 repeat protein